MGLGEFFRGVRADAIQRQQQQQQLFSPTSGGGLVRGIGSSRAQEGTTRDAEQQQGPAIAVRLRPLSAARNLWANVASASVTKLGMMDAVGKKFVTEPKTGLQLPSEYCTRGPTSGCAPLTGLGVREKRIAGIPIKVYACGLYVDTASAKKAVGSKFVGKKASDVCKDQALYSAVLSSSDVDKTVSLVLARDMDSAKIRDALAERLRLSRVKWHHVTCQMALRHGQRQDPRRAGGAAAAALGAGSPSLKEFEGYFTGGVKKGQTITFSAVGGKLHTTVPGASKAGVIADPKLCVALFDVYLGKDPAVPGAKKSLGEKLAGVVTAQYPRHGEVDAGGVRCGGDVIWDVEVM
eukprot:CAMPEP_0197616070 /NCGR_PEP_ID=MMETSP1326-20131121/60343_1 /TAXON_ID=1155430 /ORGANISM="Genus nov. species nov., Strain RCC2288" /LENGTH=349 /DNA_ID=CAMNT_0043184951 /DNA_START=280 /DNA_END=1331 /DNA_ORIENTATION=-